MIFSLLQCFICCSRPIHATWTLFIMFAAKLIGASKFPMPLHCIQAPLEFLIWVGGKYIQKKCSPQPAEFSIQMYSAIGPEKSHYINLAWSLPPLFSILSHGLGGFTEEDTRRRIMFREPSQNNWSTRGCLIERAVFTPCESSSFLDCLAALGAVSGAVVWAIRLCSAMILS